MKRRPKRKPKALSHTEAQGTQRKAIVFVLIKTPADSASLRETVFLFSHMGLMG
jgi:hypothetical protein